MGSEAVARLFEGADGACRFARWGRPLVPVLFGVEAETLGIFTAAFGAVVALTRHGSAEGPNPIRLLNCSRSSDCSRSMGQEG